MLIAGALVRLFASVPPVAGQGSAQTEGRAAAFAPATATLPRPARGPQAEPGDDTPAARARFDAFLAVAREKRQPESMAEAEPQRDPRLPPSSGDARQDLEAISRRLDGLATVNDDVWNARQAVTREGPGFHRDGIDRDAALERRHAANRARIDLDAVVENAQRAPSVGVDAAKANFWKRFAGGCFALALTGLMTAAAVATGGGLAIAGAVLMGALAVKSCADAFYAHRMVMNERATAAGQSPPYELPMGDNAFGNWIHAALPSSWSAEARSKFAGIAAGVLTFAIGIATTLVAGWDNLAWVGGGIALTLIGEVVRARADPLARPDLHEADGQALARYMDLASELAARQEELDRMGHALAEMPPAFADRVRAQNELNARKAAFDADARAIFEAMERDVESMAKRVENVTVLHHAPASGARNRIRDVASPALSVAPDAVQAGVSSMDYSFAPMIAEMLRFGAMSAEALRVRLQRGDREALLQAHGEAIAELTARPLDPRLKA